MKAYRSRAFGGLAHVQAMHALIAAAWRAHGPRLPFHVGDLHWRLRPQPGRDAQREIRLWYSEPGELSGFAWLDSQDEGDTQCHPDAPCEELEPQLLDSLEERSRAAGALPIMVGGFEGDDFRTALLLGRGYRRGLAQAVVQAALRRLGEAGAESVVVCPMSDNPVACALYQSVGFTTVAYAYDSTYSFEKSPRGPLARRRNEAGGAVGSGLNFLLSQDQEDLQ